MAKIAKIQMFRALIIRGKLTKRLGTVKHWLFVNALAFSRVLFGMCSGKGTAWGLPTSDDTLIKGGK
jgi:hypothetical protein